MTSGVCRGDRSVASALRMRAAQVVGELDPVGQLDEQDQLAEPAGVAGVLDVDDEAVGDLVEPFDDGVEVARSETHAAAVERGVGPTADDARPVLGERHPVAMAPDAREVLEVGGPVLRAVTIVPETDRHRRHRLGDHELAGHTRRTDVTVRSERLDGAAEQAATDLTGAHWLQRRGADERRADVGAAADRVDRHADDLADPAEAVGGQRRSGRADPAQFVGRWLNAALRQAIRNGADEPNTVVAVSATTFHSLRQSRPMPGRRRRARSSPRRAARTRGSSTSSSRSS